MTGVKLTVLGCSGSYPGPGQACSGYLVRSAGATTVLDLGSGTLANLQLYVAIADVDAIVLTHEHPDHWLDLMLLRSAMRHVLHLEGLAVYGTAGVLERATALAGAMAPTFRWTTVDDGSTVAVGDQQLRFSRTDHPVETLAVRIDAEIDGPTDSEVDGHTDAGAGDGPTGDGGGDSGHRTLAYTADTGPDWDTGGRFDDVHLLLCEATLRTADEGRVQHLSGRQAGVLARATRARRLLLTHVSPDVDPVAQRAAAAAIFDGPVDIATTHETYDV